MGKTPTTEKKTLGENKKLSYALTLFVSVHHSSKLSDFLGSKRRGGERTKLSGKKKRGGR